MHAAPRPPPRRTGRARERRHHPVIPAMHQIEQVLRRREPPARQQHDRPDLAEHQDEDDGGRRPARADRRRRDPPPGSARPESSAAELGAVHGRGSGSQATNAKGHQREGGGSGEPGWGARVGGEAKRAQAGDDPGERERRQPQRLEAAAPPTARPRRPGGGPSRGDPAPTPGVEIHRQGLKNEPARPRRSRGATAVASQTTAATARTAVSGVGQERTGRAGGRDDSTAASPRPARPPARSAGARGRADAVRNAPICS